MADTITTSLQQSVDQLSEDVERVHLLVNGTSAETVVTEDGSLIPTVRKALLDNLYFKTPPLPWTPGAVNIVFNQLFVYNDPVQGPQWWYAPLAANSTPVTLPTSPTNNTAWRLYVDTNVVAQKYAPLESPIFTGNPQAPTPTLTSNSNTIATTAFVANAIVNALSEAGQGSVNYTNLNVSGTSALNILNVTGKSTFTGDFDASATTGRFNNLLLTSPTSTLGFEGTVGAGVTKTSIGQVGVQTQTVTSNVMVNGVATASDTAAAFMGHGNNFMDYLSITGNGERPVTDPRLVVTGITQLENLNITGSVTGISFGVDAQDIAPNSVDITTTLHVAGDATFDSAVTVAGMTNTGDLTIGGNTIVPTLTVGTSLLVGAGASTTITDDLTVGGDVSLGGADGTTRVANLQITGSVSGLDIDFTAQDLIVKSLSSISTIEASTGLTVGGDSLLATQDEDTGVWSGETVVNNLTVHGTVTGLPAPDVTGQDINVASVTTTGNATVAGTLGVTGPTTLAATTATTVNATTSVTTPKVTTPKVVMTTTQESVTETYTPDGTKNFYNLTLTGNLTLGAIPVVTGEACTYMVYVQQDATGGRSVSFDAAYSQLNDSEINVTANGVTILQIVYCGFGTVLDLTVIPRT